MGYQLVNEKQRAKRAIRRRKKASFVLFALILLAIFVALYFYWHSIIPTIVDIAQTKVHSQTLLAVNQAVAVVLSDNLDYDNLIQIQRDQNNNVQLITANSLQINNLARKMATVSQTKIDSLAQSDIDIPFGTISGMPLLTGKGPHVTITLTPIGAVNCNFTSSFESVGINQTLHRIYINVNSTIDLVIPTSHYTVESTIPILVCESIIVGTVPNTYLNGGFILGGQ